MPIDLLEQSPEFTPAQAFLCAVDEAIKATVRSLQDVGLDEESIWNAFSAAMDLLHHSAMAVDREPFRGDLRPGQPASRRAARSCAGR
jgi:hypothetical protein